jgi:hypothetical protein
MIFERRLAQVLAAADADVALAARRTLLSERARLAVGAREAGDPLAGRARPIRSRLAESLVKASEFPVRDFPTTTPPLSGKRSTMGSTVALQATRLGCRTAVLPHAAAFDDRCERARRQGEDDRIQA